MKTIRYLVADDVDPSPQAFAVAAMHNIEAIAIAVQAVADTFRGKRAEQTIDRLTRLAERLARVSASVMQ